MHNISAEIRLGLRVKSTIEEQRATITDLQSVVAQHQKEIQDLTAAFKAQAAQIQKVSERLESIPSTPRLFENR